jgi:hypothetical protein
MLIEAKVGIYPASGPQLDSSLPGYPGFVFFIIPDNQFCAGNSSVGLQQVFIRNASEEPVFPWQISAQIFPPFPFLFRRETNRIT